jgi:tRNA A-37 threonylcarbamoyl transferase component Bud32
MDNSIQNALTEEKKTYRSGQLKGLCLKGFEDLDIRSIPFDKPVREYTGFYRLLKRTRSRSIVSFDFTTGGVTHRIYAKRYRVWRLTRRLAYLFIPSKCINEWRLGFSLLKKGIMTPLPLIAAEYRAGPFIKENYLVTRGIEPYESLNHIFKNMPDQKTKRDLLASLAHFIRDVHGRGFYHDDISLNHIFTHENPGEGRQFALIDLDNSRLLDQLPQRMIERNLFQLFHSANVSVWPYEERLMFLECYLGNRPSRELLEKINALALRKTCGSLF